MDLGSAAEGAALMATFFFGIRLFVRVWIIGGLLVACRMIQAPHIYYGVLTLGCLTATRITITDERTALRNLPTWLQVAIIGAIGSIFLFERWVTRRYSSPALSVDPCFAGTWRIHYPTLSIRDTLVWMVLAGIALANALPQLVAFATGLLFYKSARASKHRAARPFESSVGWTAFSALVSSMISNTLLLITHTGDDLQERLIHMFSFADQAYVVGALIAAFAAARLTSAE